MIEIESTNGAFTRGDNRLPELKMSRMIIVSIHVLLSVLFYGGCTSTFEEALQIRFKRDSVLLAKNETEIALTVECKNSGNVNLLLYGIMSNLLTNADAERLCNVNRVGGGIGLMLFDHKLSPVYAVETIPDSIKHKRLDERTFKSEMADSKKRFLGGTRVLKASQVLELVLNVDMRQFNLRPGQYHLKLVYYAGKGLTDDFVVGQQQIERDMHLYDAKLYQGCVLSDQIVLTVR